MRLCFPLCARLCGHAALRKAGADTRLTIQRLFGKIKKEVRGGGGCVVSCLALTTSMCPPQHERIRVVGIRLLRVATLFPCIVLCLVRPIALHSTLRVAEVPCRCPC